MSSFNDYKEEREEAAILLKKAAQFIDEGRHLKEGDEEWRRLDIELVTAISNGAMDYKENIVYLEKIIDANIYGTSSNACKELIRYCYQDKEYVNKYLPKIVSILREKSIYVDDMWPHGPWDEGVSEEWFREYNEDIEELIWALLFAGLSNVDGVEFKCRIEVMDVSYNILCDEEYSPLDRKNAFKVLDKCIEGLEEDIDYLGEYKEYGEGEGKYSDGVKRSLYEYVKWDELYNKVRKFIPNAKYYNPLKS